MQSKKTLGDKITWVDAGKALKAHKKEEIYYHTDHHWTTLGAYYAYEEMAETVKTGSGEKPETESICSDQCV